MAKKTIKVFAPVRDFTGKVAGVDFTDGAGATGDRNALNYFRRHGYGIGKRPTPATPDPDPVPPASVPPAEGDGDVDAEFDPDKASVDEVIKYLEQADEAERERVIAAETAGKARKGILGEPDGDV